MGEVLEQFDFGNSYSEQLGFGNADGGDDWFSDENNNNYEGNSRDSGADVAFYMTAQSIFQLKGKGMKFAFMAYFGVEEL